jgi:hypothetical protein
MLNQNKIKAGLAPGRKVAKEIFLFALDSLTKPCLSLHLGGFARASVWI